MSTARAPTGEERLATLVTAVRALAESCDQPDLAARVEEHHGRARALEVAIVVVGETKRGKSSLINALVERPGLCPVDVDVATNAALILHHAPQPSALVLTESEPSGHEIGLDEIADWATVEGNPWNQKLVSAVRVGLDHRLLAEGVELIDTPGVGGLDSSHAKVTLAALGRAAGLVFVVDATRPLLSIELDFLRAAAGTARGVVLALTKVDLAPATWEEILQEDRELLAKHAPELAEAPILPVSSRLRERALSAGDAELATELLARSGIAGLEAELLAMAERERGARRADVAGSCVGVLEVIERHEVQQLRSATGDPGFAERSREAQARLESYTSQSALWSTTLQAELNHMALELDGEADRAFTEIGRHYQEIVAAGGGELVASLPADIAGGVRSVVVDLMTLTGERMSRAARLLAQTFEIEGFAAHVPASAAAPEVSPHQPLTTQEPSSRATLVRTASGGMLGFGVGGVLVTALSIALPGAGLLIGAPLAWIFGSEQRRQHQEAQQRLLRSELGAYVREVMTQARGDVKRALGERRIEFQNEMTREVYRSVEARKRLLRSEIDEHKRLAGADKTRRGQAQAQARERLERIRKLRLFAGTLIPQDDSGPAETAVSRAG